MAPLAPNPPRDALDPSPRGLGDEALHLYLAGGALRGVPTSSFSWDRPGGAIRVAPTGLDFDVRPGGVICAAPIDLPLGVSLSGCYSAALAGVAPALRRSGLLGLLGHSSHRLLLLRGLCHNVHDGQELRCRVRSGARPGLEGLGQRKLGYIPGDGPGAGNRGRNAEVSKIGGSIKRMRRMK